MATDADVVTPADTSAPSDAKLTNLADVDSNHGVLDRAILNGSPGQDEIENKHIRSVEDQINSADVSVSGGSDTEASRGDSKGKDGSHARASSVKKPATFKAVSVNKTFLAAKGGPASSPAVKAADKSNASSLSTTPTGTSTLSGTRPRLIAKTGSGAGTGPKFSSAVNGAKGAAGPDASAVWNKNRPAPPPEPKKFTDEELQKFGIHMASRLGPESSQGQNNWADIEDDDDWAPDTITWTDGTKVTLTQHEEQAPLAPEPVPATVQAPPQAPAQAQAVATAPPPVPKEAPRLVDKSRSPAPAETASPSTRPATLPSGKGMILKAGGSTEKPALVAKPPAVVGPAKSPWAKLPPVDKASPADHPPGPHGHLPVRDNHLQSVSPPLPTREIAADDFSRSTWREGPSAGNRELFNSHSGRYEPVGERRGSMRSDSHQRQPAVLQRPSQSDHPEPSPAFQTNRTQQEPPFGRRRGSSNLSGTGYPPRPPFGPHDLQAGLRRPSVTASIESAHSPQLRHISPVEGQGPQRLHPGQPWQPRGSPSTAHASLHNPPAPPAPVQQVPEVPAAEDYEYQKKIMHEKRELAYQRRREEEARLEAEKQKRIQAKLAALGPAPERKSAKKESSNDESRGAVHIQQRQPSKDSDDSKQSKDAPASTASGPGSTAGPTEEATESAAKPLRDSVPAQLRNRQDVKPASDHADTTSSAPPRNRQDAKASWGQGAAAQPDRFTASWAPAVQQSSSNVWAPNNARGLGNGTFNTHLGRGPVSPEATTAQPAKGPSPIGPPSTQRPSNASGATQPASVSGRQESALLRSRWSNAVVDNDRAVVEQNRARRAEQERQLADRGLTLADAMPEIKDTWRPHDPHPSLRNAPDLSRPGVPTGPARTDFSAPPAGPGGLGGPGSATMLPTTSSTPQSRTSRFFPARDVRHEFAPSSEPQRPQSPSPPPPDTAGHPAFDGDVDHPHVSLPRPQPVVRLPPSAAGAQGAPAARPAGNFSWANPAPFKDGAATSVPTGPAGQQRDWERQSSGHRHAPHSSQDSTQSNAAWDEKFRTLFSDRKAPLHRKGAPPSHITFVDASSRSALDQTTRHEMATVSLPRTPTQTHARLRTVTEDASLFFAATTFARKNFNAAPRAYMVKPVSEECFAAQEMGSLPPVNIPREAPEAAWHPATQPSDKRTGVRRFVNADISSVPQHWVPQDVSANGAPEYRIKLPGMTDARTTPAPQLRTRSNPRRQASARGPRPSQGSSRGGKNSEASSQAGDAPPSRPHGRGGRSSYRGRGSDWTRRASSAQPTQ